MYRRRHSFPSVRVYTGRTRVRSIVALPFVNARKQKGRPGAMIVPLHECDARLTRS